MSDIVISSKVRLARNYQDLPFRNKITPEQSESCVQRTLNALRTLPQPYSFLPLRDMEEIEKKSLLEAHLISEDLMEHEEHGAVLIRMDQTISVMMNEEDHLRIQGFCEGDALDKAAERAFSIDDVLQGQLSFAFDSQLGYLTACPTNAGTGLRASVMMHLPMLTLYKQMGKMNQLAAKLGLTLRGIYGEGSEAQGNLYHLSNQVTLGRTEKEMIDAVSATASQIAEMERSFRERAMEKDSLSFEDQLFRSFGILSNARLISIKEFMTHWSNLRLGAALKKLPVSAGVCDSLLTAAQPAHVIKAAGAALSDKDADAYRSELIRHALQNGG